MKIKEIRILTWDAVRKTCMEKGWYTKGSNEDYEKLSDFVVSDNVDTERIYKIAENIKEHSDTPYSVFHICSILARNCHSWFDDADDAI